MKEKIDSLEKELEALKAKKTTRRAPAKKAEEE
jgi:hypothetical protein